MTVLRTIYLLWILVLGTTAWADGEGPTTARLFTSDDTLEVTIRAPFTTIMKKRSLAEDQPATLTYHDATEGEVTVDLGIRARGRYRRQSRVCPWAPLRLNFKKSSARETEFAGSDKMKLVTHCRNGSRRYEQALLSEYLAYRIFNVLTDTSFRVRLMRVTYIDSDRKDRKREEFAFLIEHDDQVGKRIGMEVNEISSTKVEHLDGPFTNLGSLFQYLAANTDFSPIKGARGEPCCHNSVLFGEEHGQILSIPYDLDMTGFVNAPHSAPNPKFKLRSVRQRLYRGRCYNNQYLDTSIKVFLRQKQAIYDLVASNEHLDGSNRKRTVRFIDEFFATIEDPREVNARLIKKCVGAYRSG